MIKSFYRIADTFARSVVLVLFTTLLIVGAIQVLARYIFSAPLDWSEELLKFAHVWLVFMAIPIAYNYGSHICVDMISGLLPQKWQNALSFVVDMLWIGFSAVFIYYSVIIIEVAQNQTSAGLQIPMSYVYFGVVLGVSYLLLCSVRNLVCRMMPLFRREAGR